MNRKPRILSKFLGGPPQSSATNQSFDSSNVHSPQLRPSASQNATYSAGAAISCMDRSSNGQRCVIGGQKVFKILRIEGSTLTEEIDLRAAITAYATNHDPSAASAEQLSIRAVTWSHSSLESTIITASGNGRITIYDLNRGAEGFEVARIPDHVRQVHKLAINPHKDNWLLSASQDGTVRFFDIKKRQADHNGSRFGAQIIFKCNADAIRDVKWSPSTGVEFACCSDQGIIQKWDIRKPNAPLMRLQAHTGSCRSISYHPDGYHLASGGADQMVKVWDMSKDADRHQKPLHAFTTPAPLARVTWRPPCWSATAQGRRAAQIAVAYDDLNSAKNQISSVHVWDFARSALPFKEIDQWDNAPATMLWNTRDLLWSADKDGNFTQTDIAFVPPLINRRSLSTFAFSPTGEVLMFLEQRPTPRRPRPSISSEATNGFSHRLSGPLLSASKSDSEEDVVGSFLGPRQRKGHRRRNSGRSSHQYSTTPPSTTGMENRIMTLDEAIKVTGPYKPQQVMAIGLAPSTATPSLYKYFSGRYLKLLSKHILSMSEDPPVDLSIASVAESFAKASEDVSFFRLAQTWRLLGFTMQTLIERRAEYHRRARLTAASPPTPASHREEETDVVLQSTSQSELSEDTPRKYSENSRLESPLHQSAMSLISEEMESTSNVATPRVRPVRDQAAHVTNEAMHTSIVADDEDLKLPEAVHPKRPMPIPVPGAKNGSDERSSSVEGYDFYGLESISPTQDSQDYVAPQRKQPLRLDYQERNNSSSRIQPQRHDSNESFQMFSTSADSLSKFMQSEVSASSSYKREDSRALRHRVHEWENSQSPDRKHRPSIDSDAPNRSDSSMNALALGSSEMARAVRKGVPFKPSSPPVFRVQEASTPLSVIVDRRIRSSPISKNVSPQPSDRISEAMSQDPNIILSDFYPWPNDPSFMIVPADPATLIPRAIDFEVQNGSIHAAIMILLFRSLLPPKAIDGLQATAILKQYNHRLMTMKLFTEASSLRNVCVPEYPEVYALSQEDIKTGFFCTSCNKPIENDPSIPESEWRCPRCTQDISPCPICQMRYLDSSTIDTYRDFKKGDEVLNTWFYCPGCGHGGHATCISAWHSGPEMGEGDEWSGGGCAVEGCLHPCLPGQWRDKRVDEKRVAKEKDMDIAVKEGQRLGGKSGRNVIRDQREVKQSGAVDSVRGALGINGVGSGGSGGMERKKSVKLVAPGDKG